MTVNYIDVGMMQPNLAVWAYFLSQIVGIQSFQKKNLNKLPQPFKKQKAAVRCYVGARGQESGSSGFKSQSLPAR